MAKYRKKMLTEATQIETLGQAIALFGGDIRWHEDNQSWQVYDLAHVSWINFDMGDYIVTGPDGEHYPIKASIFEKTYDPV